MPQEIHGNLEAGGRRFAIVVSRFNEFFTRRLKDGAVDALLRHGAAEKDIRVVWVPGTFELPLAVQRLAETKQFHAVIGLGLVLRGETSHHEHVAGVAIRSIARTALTTGIPCPLGIVTADTLEQAVERAGGKQGNRGWEAALAAMEMVSVLAGMENCKPEEKTLP
jgi:6,7-dimethyl-8-ribityllumazine synthase